MNVNDRIAANIRGLRAMRRLSQQDLADRVADLVATEFGRMSVSTIEAGTRPARAHELVAIADVLEVGIDDLMTGGFGQ